MALRIFTGIVGIGVAAVVIQFGGLPFVLFALFLALVGWHEYSAAFAKIGTMTTYIFGAIILVLMLLAARYGTPENILAVITLGTAAIFLLTVILHGSVRPTDACVSVGGVLYLGLPFAHLIFLRFMPGGTLPVAEGLFGEGLPAVGGVDFGQIFSGATIEVGCALIWILFACTWASDTFAYFVGSAIGSHKLASSISPKKTVEGFVGSLVGTALTGVAVGGYLFGFPLVPMAIAGFVLAVVATLGDLVESVIKRYVGVKDSGFLIPGHGGVLDRFDSIFYTAPVFYYCVIYAGVV